MTQSSALGGSFKSLIMGVETPKQASHIDNLLFEEFAADAPLIGLAYTNLVVLLAALACFAGLSPDLGILYVLSSLAFIAVITILNVTVFSKVENGLRKSLVALSILGYEATLIFVLLLDFIGPEHSASFIIIFAIVGMSFISISLIARFSLIFVLNKILVVFVCGLYVYFSPNTGLSPLPFFAVSIVCLLMISAIGYWVIKRNREATWLRSELAVLNQLANERNERLDKAQKQAKENFDIRQSLLSYIGHDLRQPVNAADFILRELAIKEDLPEKTALIQNVNNCVRSTKRMIEDILQLTHYNNSDIEVIEEALDINEMFQQLIQEYSERAAEANITLRCVTTRVIVKSDGVLVARIIRNLIQNAIKHAYADKLVLGLRRRYGSVEIWVVDNGRGLGPTAPKAPPKSSASPSKLGLGLIISKQLAAACGTQLTMVSNKDRGTCARLRIPKAKVITRSLSNDWVP